MASSYVIEKPHFGSHIQLLPHLWQFAVSMKAIQLYL